MTLKEYEIPQNRASVNIPNVAQETPLPSRGGMNCDSFYRMHMAR